MRSSAKFPENLNLQQFKVIDLGASRKCICNFLKFLVVISSNFGRVSYRFRDIDEYSLFPPANPCLTPPLSGTRQNFWIKLTTRKQESWGYSVVKVA